AGLSFLDEEVAAPAFAETAESPAAEGAEEVEEDISAGLSFLDEEIAAPAFAETAESPAAEGAEEVEEDISAGLSFLDEEVAAPAFAETAESPAAAGAEEVEEAVSAGLSFLDEEVAAPAFAETAESPAAAGAEEVEEDISAGLSFLDEEVVAPAFAETAESPAAAGAEEVEEEVSAGLSFLDEEVAAPAFAETAESPAAEGAEEVEEAVSAGLSFLDEEAAPTADEIDEQLIEEQEIQFTVPGEATAASAFEEVVAEEIEDDDVIEFVVPGEELVVEQSSFSSELQDSEEVLFEVVADDVKVDPLPAEDSAVLSSSDLVDGEKAVEFVEVVEEEPVSTKPVEEEEQLFEEYTPSLPGASQPVVAAVPQSLEEEEQDLFSEEFADSPVETEESSQESLLQAEEEFDEYSPDLPSSQPIKDLAEDNELDLFSEGEEKDSADFIETEQEDQGEVTPTAVLKDMVEETAPVALLDGSTVVSSVTGYDENELATLRSCVDSLQDDITDERIQSLFNEINSLRSRQVFGYTEKIFLQLLSSICQHIRNSRIDFYPMSLQVLEKVFSALEVSHSARSTADQTQQQLLECTSQVLLLQQKAVSRWQPEDRGDELKDVSGTETTVETDRKITSSQEVEGHVASETEKMLLAVFQQEMAQMRQTFFDEISSLRKELADRQ
ncbi:MAG: hypothetical protein KKC77_07975, partial [Proteobacteria bacterium]|nr:hypothetical protein [Pseudomonadota bacterium]